MAFTSLTTDEISVGEAVKNSTLTKIKDDLDDLNTRVTALDLSIAEAPIVFRVSGYYSNLGSNERTAILETTCNYDLTITGVYVICDTAGSSGTTEVDLKHNTSGSFVTVFTTKPSVAYSAGNDAVSSNAVLNSGAVNVSAGKILQLSITSAQTGGKNFIVRVDYIKTV